MTEQVPDITSLPAPTKSVLKTFAKRTALVAVAAAVTAAIYLKVTKSGDETTVNVDTLNA